MPAEPSRKRPPSGDLYSARLEQLLESAAQRAVPARDAAYAIPRIKPDGQETRSIREGLLQQIERTSVLPAFPAIVSRLDDVIAKPHVDARAIAEVLSLDPALVSQLLALVNSALFGLKHEVRKIDQAVALVGVDSIRALVFSTSVMKVFQSSSGPEFDHRRFWEHSITTAIAARLIASSLIGALPDPVDEEEAFLAGLIHDVGKIVIARNFAEDSESIEALARDERLSTYDAELAVLGIRHTDIGHRLLSQWKLPVALAAAVRYHHEPGSGGRMAWIVHFADRISRVLGFHPDSAVMPRFDPLTWTELALPDSVVESIGSQVLGHFADTRQLLLRAGLGSSA